MKDENSKASYEIQKIYNSQSSVTLELTETKQFNTRLEAQLSQIRTDYDCLK